MFHFLYTVYSDRSVLYYHMDQHLSDFLKTLVFSTDQFIDRILDDLIRFLWHDRLIDIQDTHPVLIQTRHGILSICLTIYTVFNLFVM